MIIILRQMFYLLESKERLQAYRCFIAMLLMGFVEVIGVASIMPFIAVLADPDAVMHHAKLALLYHQLHFSNLHHFLIFLGIVVLGILVVGNAVAMATTWSIYHFTSAREHSLSTRIFTHYLAQPYIFFVNRNISELSKNILSEVVTIINRAFIPAMQLIAKSIIAILILLLLLLVNPILACVLGGVLGGAYLGIYFKARKKLALLSKRSFLDNQQKYKIVTESFYGIKDIKLLGREPYFLEKFSYHAKQHAEDSAISHLIAHIPRFALETIAFGGVLIIILYLLLMEKNINDALPLLALYAFASLRLMPALQQIFTSVAFLRVSKDALATISLDLQNEQTRLNYPENSVNHRFDSLSLFRYHLELRNINFSYPNTKKPTLHNLNLRIKAGTTVGFVGLSGAGKTTLVDLILGLLMCESGEMLIDGVPLNRLNLKVWQQQIGYVPQSIFLADESIMNNIAFGIPSSLINFTAIEQAAKLANIHDFIMNHLPDRYQTMVGDRGIRLSGGQRQRIGIARALYHSPQILVLDEATNALDNVTESIIMEAVSSLAHFKTIIIVAHKISTLNMCDQIYIFTEGQIEDKGTYAELLEKNAIFRTLVGNDYQGSFHESIRHHPCTGKF